MDVEGAVRCDVDVELEELVDAALLLGVSVGEAGGGVGGEAVEVGEAGPVGLAVLIPEVELGQVASEGEAFVCNFGEGVGELGVVDLVSGVGADDGGFF